MVNWRTADEQRLNVVLKDEKRLLREADTNMGLFMLEIYCGKDLWRIKSEDARVDGEYQTVM